MPFISSLFDYNKASEVEIFAEDAKDLTEREMAIIQYTKQPYIVMARSNCRRRRSAL